jgi:uncharacterized membrane protein
MKTVALVVGMVLFVLGLDWIGQGTGVFPWPRDSGMNNDINWAYYGAGVAVLGFIVIWLSRRPSR